MAKVTVPMLDDMKCVLDIDGQQVTYWFEDDSQISAVAINRFAIGSIVQYLVDRLDEQNRRIAALSDKVQKLEQSIAIETGAF